MVLNLQRWWKVFPGGIQSLRGIWRQQLPPRDINFSWYWWGGFSSVVACRRFLHVAILGQISRGHGLRQYYELGFMVVMIVDSLRHTCPRGGMKRAFTFIPTRPYTCRQRMAASLLQSQLRRRSRSVPFIDKKTVLIMLPEKDLENRGVGDNMCAEADENERHTRPGCG